MANEARTDVGAAVIAGVIVGAIAAYLSGSLRTVDALREGPIVPALQAVIGVIAAIAFGLNSYRSLRKQSAQRAADLVADAVKKAASETGRDIAEVKKEEVTGTVEGAKVSPAQVERLVEQVQQKLLTAEEYLKKELEPIGVEFLPPLPRNAKRFMNRLRVNMVIAFRRKLTTTDPKVTAAHIGKWLILGDRWPQLARSLSAQPGRFAAMERQAADAPRPERDPFDAAVESLSPSYIGDEDLRAFVASKPSIALVLERLVRYGEAARPTNGNGTSTAA